MGGRGINLKRFYRFAFILPFLSGSLFAASSTYTFTAGAGADKWAYDAVDTSNPPTSGPDLPGQIEITDYTSIELANNVYHSSAIYSTGMSFLNCKFTIGEATSSISQIYIEWDGYNTAFNSTGTQIRIWNFNSSSWIFLDGYDGEAEVVLSSAIASNFGNYISGGYLYAYAVGRGAGTGDPPSVLYSDFIKVIVDYSGGGTSPPCTYDFSGGSSDTNRVGYYADANWLLITSPDLTGQTAFPAGAYSLVGSSDASHYVSTATALHAMHHFKFIIGEDTNTIDGIFVEWVGKGNDYNSGNQYCKLGIWNYQTKARDIFDEDTGLVAEVTLSTTITSGYLSYIDTTTSRLDVIMVGGQYSNPNDGAIWTNYVKVVISTQAAADTTPPNIADNQPGDNVVRNSAGTTYNVDFADSGTGLDTIQYKVMSGPSQTGNLIIDWTNIALPGGAANYTTDWTVNFNSLYSSPSTNYVSVRAWDVAGSTGAMDDVFYILKDITPPSAISNLTALVGNNAGEIQLKWTAPGDDGTMGGSATQYDVKYATRYIGTADYNASWTYTYVQGWTPAAPGSQEPPILSGFSEGVTYWFAIKAKDEVNNWSVWPGTSTGINSASFNYAKPATGVIGTFSGDFSQAAGAVYDSGSSGGDEAYGIAVDTISGGGPYVYVVGKSSQNGNFDFLTIKYDAGGTKLKAAAFGQNFDDSANGVAIDANGNVFVTGSLSDGANNDFLTIKYDSNLNIISSVTYSGGVDNVAKGIALMPGGNVVITGYAYNGTDNDYFTIKYDNSLNAISSITYNGGNADVAAEVAVDNTGNIYVTGDSHNGTDNDYCTIKYNSDLSGFISSSTYNGGGIDKALGLDIDGAGNVFVTGEKFNGSNYDYMTIKYNGGLGIISSVTFDSGGADIAKSIAVAADGNVFITGAASDKYCTIKYGNDLGFISSTTYGGTFDSAYAVAVGTSNYVYVTGASEVGSPNMDFRTIRYYLDGIGGDTTAPGQVTGLAAYQDSSANTVKLSWVTPGDDNYSGALSAGSEYRIQYSTANPASVNWSTSTAQVIISTSGVSPGVLVSTSITLSLNKMYSFKMWAGDETGNWSAVSAVVSVFNSQFSFENIGQSGGAPNLTIDKDNNLHVAYNFATNQELRYIKRTGTTWQGSPTTVDSLVNTPWSPSIALDANANPHIAYGDQSPNYDLKYAKFDGVWSTSTIDAASYNGWHESIAIDGADNPHIAYKDDNTEDALKYAKLKNGTWATEIVDTTNFTGRHPSIALDGNGTPRISYTYVTGWDLMYAKYSYPSWATETVDDTSADVGRYTSLALDGSGNPHISYYDDASDNLKYAYYDGATWTKTVVDPGVGAGITDNTSQYCSIALDGSGNPHIAYRDQPNQDIKYAAYDGIKWSTNTVDSEGNTGYWNSIAIDGAGDVHIMYTFGGELKAAHWSGTGLTAPMGGNARGKVQAPSAFSAPNIYSSSITWSWTDNSSNELGFRLYGAATSTGPFSLIADTDTIVAGNVSYSETGLNLGTSYFRYVVAVNAGGIVTSGGVTAKTLEDNDAPTVPTLISPINEATTNYATIAFDWADSTDAVSGVSNYDLQVSTDFNFNSVNYSSSPVVSQASFTVSEGNYYWQVRAKDKAGNYSDWSSTRALTVDVTLPTAGVTVPVEGAYLNNVTQIKGTAEDNIKVSTVTVSIQRLSDKWYWSPGPQWAVSEAWNGVNDLYTSSWTLTSLPGWIDGSSYTVVAKAQDTANNWSAVYSTVTFTYDNSAPVSSATYPVNGGHYVDVDSITGTASDGVSGVNEVNIRLKRPADNKYWDAVGSSWTFSAVWSTATGTTNWSFNAIPVIWSTGSYSIQPRAKDAAGNWETPTSSTTFDIVFATPSAPSGFNGVAMTATSIKWIWNDVANEDGYYIRSSTGGLFKTLLADATSWLEGSLSVNTSYQRYAESYNASGSSGSASVTRYTLANNHSGLSFSGITGSSATFQWTHGNPAYTRWGIYRSTDNFATSTTTVKDFAANYTSSAYTDTGLTDLTTYWYKVQAFNGDGIGSLFNNIISTKTPDGTPPTVGIIKPAAAYVNSLAQIAGTAADNGGINSVNVEIKRNSDNSYFDSAAWVTGQTWLSASVYTSSWTYSDVDLAWINGSSYTITARSCDTALIYSSTVSAAFTYDIDLPISAVTHPVESGKYDFVTQITGTSADTVSAINTADISIERKDDAKYWNGSSWVAGQSWLAAPPSDGAYDTLTENWKFDIAYSTDVFSSTGTYVVSSRARDVTQNYETALSSVTFEIVFSTPPAVGGIQGVAVATDSINWSWSDIIEEDNYRIKSSTGGIIKDALAADTTFWIEKVLSANTTRWVYVEAYNLIGSSASPSPVVYTLADIPAISGFSGVWYTSATVTVGVNANPDGTEYYVECGTASDFSVTDQISGWIASDNWPVSSLADDTTYYFRVRARNGDAVLTDFSLTAATTTLYIDLVSPTVGITEPVNNSYVNANALTQINGTCADDVAVSTAAIRIFNQINANYWNNNTTIWDATLTPETAWFAPTLSAGGTFWWFNSPGWADTKVYEISAKAKDTAGNWSAVFSTAVFTYDVTKPNSAVSVPENGMKLTTLTSLGGTAADATSGISQVKIQITDLTQGATYWNGSGWVETSAWLPVSGVDPWSYSFVDGDWTEGHIYKIQSQATDAAVNIESAVNQSTFTFSKAGVKLQVLLPGETATPGIAPGKIGTPSVQTAGVAFSVTVNAVDDLWNVAVNAVATAQITTSDPNDTEPGSSTMISGTKILSLTMVTAGTATITATDTDGTPLTSDISPVVTVNPNTAAKLQVIAPGETAAAGTGGGKTGTPAVQYAGAVFTVTVNACDNYWNVVSTATTVNVTTSDIADADPGNIVLTAGTNNVNVTLVTPSTGTLITASSAGYTDGVSAYVVVSSTDVVPPTVGITEPAAGYVNSLAKIAGTTNDNIAVSSVTLWIEREDTFVWDGGTWTGAGVWIPADNVYISSWSYTTAVSLSAGASYTIIAKAQDTSGNWSTVYSTVTFTYDISLPTSAVTYPVESGQYTDVTGITGTSTDTVSGAWATKIKIFALTGPYIGAWWQDGTGWQGAEFWNDASGTASWSFDTSMIGWPAGTYNIQSKAQDVAGNWEVPVSSVTFEIIPSTPAAPAGFAGIAASPSSIRWNWADGADENGYKILTDTGGLVAVLAAGTTFYIESGFGVNTQYTRYAEAYNTAGSSVSAVSSVYTLAYPPLTTAVVASSTGSVTITWQDNSNPAGTRWGIERSTDNFATSTPLKVFADNYTAIGYTNTGLYSNTTYYYRVRAYNGGAVATAFDSAVSTVTASVPPPASPAAFSGTAMDSASIMWTWTDSSANENGFNIKTATGGVVAGLASNTTYWLESGLNVNTSYYRYAEAYNASGSSAAAGSLVYTFANPPSGSYVSSVSSGSVTLTWSINGNPGGTEYYTECDTSPAFVSPDGNSGWIIATSTAYFTFVSLSAETTYYLRVCARNGWGVITSYDSVAAMTAAAEVVVSTPAAPTVFSGAAQSASSIMWTWTVNSSNEDGFYLKNSSDAVVQTLPAGATFYLETVLGVNTENYRYLVSYNTAGENASIPAAVYTLANAPSAFTVTVTSCAVTLDWSANGNPAGTDYDIEWSTAGDFSVTDYATTTDVSYQITPLLSETTYYVRVSALNSDAYSTAFYETSAFTAEPDLTAPSAVSAFTAETANIKGAVKLSWTNPGDDGTVGAIPGGAQMIRYVTGASATTMPDIIKDIVPGTTEALTVSGLVPGGAYTFYIKVKDSAGNVSGEVSAAASAGAQPVLKVYGITSPITAGVSSDFTVEVKNALGVTDTSYAGAVTFESKIMDGSYAGANAMVSLPADYSFTSADSGAHVFTGAVFLEKGELYNCYVRVTDTGDALITGQQVVTVSPLDFISGIVTQKDGTPLTGVYVEAYAAGLSTGVPFTTINGSYTVIGLDIGIYTVRATWTGAGGLESSAEKQASNGTAAFNFTLGINFDLSIVQGMVLGLSASSIRAAAGLIMPRATSEYAFVEISAGRKVMRIPVAADGSFRMGNLIPGRYSARAWDGSRYSNSETLILSGGASATVKFTFPVSAEVYCWPNPFIELKTNEAGVHISYIGSSYGADLKIYTITGELVRDTRDFIAFTRADSLTGYEFIWDLRNNDRQDVASGVYFYTLELTDASGGVRKYKGKIGVVR